MIVSNNIQHVQISVREYRWSNQK